MDKHVTNKQLAAYIAGTLCTRAAGRIGNHLMECGSCLARHEKLLAVIAPRYRSLEPGDEVRERIMRSFREIRNGVAVQEQGGIRSLLERRPGLAAASFFAAVAVILVIVGVLIRGPEAPRGVSMVMERVVQGVSMDGVVARQGDEVTGGRRINLADGSAARITCDTILRIDLVGNGNVTVNEFSSDPASGVNFGITLNAGMLVSSVHAGDLDVSYEYLTPNARIVPRGTEFLLQADGGATLVIMKEGAIRVIHARTGKSLEVTAGDKCVIGDSFKSMKASGEDLNIFNDLEGLRSGKYAHLLLPSVIGSNIPAGIDVRKAGAVKDATAHDGAIARKEALGKRNAREDNSREIMRQRAEENRIQMNEVRRNSKMNMNQQMRRGR